MSWQAMEAGNPELAAWGAERFASGVAYLATVREDGAPRVHPVTPIVGEGHLFVFMEPTSPKGRDLQQDGRYAMHSSVQDSEGSNGEFFVTGRAQLQTAPEVRKLAERLSSYAPAERYILFELSVERALGTQYKDGETVRQRWPSR
jgi:hypothetical protein